MNSGLLAQPELGEDGADVLLDGPLGEVETLGDGGVFLALSHCRQDLAFSGRQLRERRSFVPRASGDEVLDHLGVDDRTPTCDLADGVDELLQVRYPLLQQV